MMRMAFTKESVDRRFPFFFLVVALLTAAGCDRNAGGGTVVARVNNSVLTMEMIREQTDSVRTLQDDEIRQYINRWITNELLYQEAQQRGFDETESIQRKLSEARKQLAIAALLETEVYSAAEKSVTENEIAAYYQSHNGEYLLRDDLVRLSMVIFTGNDAAVRFRASALGTSGWQASVDQFRADAENGVLSTADSLFFSQPALYPPELWKVASILGMFEVSFPVQTSVGYVVMRSLGQFKKGSLSPLPYVHDDILHRLTMERRQQRYQEFLQQIRSKHTIHYSYSANDSTGIGE